MNDFIEMQKQYQDYDLIMLRVKCSSEVLTVTSKIYVSFSLIDDLIYQIDQFLNNKSNETFWEIVEKGNHSIARISLQFMHEDELGHVLIEVYLEIDDCGTYSSQHCYFYIHTEIGLLDRFMKQLPKLKYGSPETIVVLNDNNINSCYKQISPC